MSRNAERVCVGHIEIHSLDGLVFISRKSVKNACGSRLTERNLCELGMHWVRSYAMYARSCSLIPTRFREDFPLSTADLHRRHAKLPGYHAC
jgi:hypothetical protein